MTNEMILPIPILDEKEMKSIDTIALEFEKLNKPGVLSKSLKSIGESTEKIIPAVVKNQIDDIKGGISESQLIAEAMKIVAVGFKEIEMRASKLTVSKKNVVKGISRYNDRVFSFDSICMARSYEIEKSLSLKEYEDILLTITQGGLTGSIGFAGIPFNFVLSTFLYFRAVQNIALHYGYDIHNDINELEFASQITVQALSNSIDDKAQNLGGTVGKMMLMTKSTVLREGLNKSYGEMVKAGGIQLGYVQVRALANKAAKKALEKEGGKPLEKTIFTEMLEQLAKRMGKSAGKKAIPIFSGVISACFDTAYMARVLKYSRLVYQKRYLLEKESRLSNY